jgi:hypothetical protein
MADERTVAVLLALYDALLGAIPAHLRAITARWDESSVHFDAYYDGEVSDEDRETMAVVDTEVLAGFPETHVVSHAVHRLDFPAEFPDSGRFVFHRQEDLPPHK